MTANRHRSHQTDVKQRTPTAEITVRDILQAVHEGAGLMTLTPVMRVIVENPLNSDQENLELLDVVRYDAALTVQLLRSANHGGSGGVALDIAAAANRIGFQMLRNLALSTGFLDDNQQAELSHRHYTALLHNWESSLYNAVGARLMAVEFNAGSPEIYFTIGLLLNIGVQFMLSHFPERYLPVFEHWWTTGGDLYQYERDALGVDHATLGQHLIRTWEFGSAIENAVLHQHRLEQENADGLNLKVLHLAHLATSVFFEARNAVGIERVNRFGEQAFGIYPRDLAALLQRIAVEADVISEKYISGSSGLTSIELLRSINQELGRATLSYDQLVRELRAAMGKVEVLAKKLEEANQRLREAAHIDALTRVYNRWYFDEFLRREFERAGRYGTFLGALMIDIDHFKRVNDRYGHLTGDRILHGVAELLGNNLRRTDVIARYGGEEFMVMLPDTNPRAVQLTAGKLHQAVAQGNHPINGKNLNVTVSIGYFAYSKTETPEIATPEQLINITDENMYQAKKNGRNQIWPSADNKEPNRKSKAEQR